MKPLKFYLITDTHYFKNALGAYGDAYEEFMDGEQKCFAETQAINEAAFDYLTKATEADIILIAGDLSFNGEKESHVAFSKLLHDVQRKSGKRIYVVTAGHDFNEHPFAFNESGRIEPAGTKFSELYDFYRDMLVMMLDDAEEYRVDLGADRDSLLERLALSRPSFDAYTVPRLVHYDLWENNLIVRDGEIVGVLDWERAIWSDPLMEERFLRYARHPAMLRGYGQETFSPEERERMRWYDILMDAAFMVDVYTRQYSDDSQYRWGKDLFRQAWNELRNDAAEE